MKKRPIFFSHTYRFLNQFELVDKNNDGFVTLEEFDAFSWAVYKEKRLTQEELRTHQWMLKNLYHKDMLGLDNKFDSEEYVNWQKTGTTTPGSGVTTPSPPTTKMSIRSEFYSEKPWQSWDVNGDHEIDHDERFRFRMKQNRQGPLQSS